MSAEPDHPLTHWEELEAWIFDVNPLGGFAFTNIDVADHFGCSPRDGTGFIQSYLGAQRAANARTLYMLHRHGRTKTAVWMAGTRTADGRAASQQYFDDVNRRFVRALAPDLIRIGARNPRARRKCEAIIEAVGDGAMRLLRAAVSGLDEDDE